MVSKVIAPVGFFKLFFDWVEELNYNLKIDFLKSMLNEDDIKFFLLAWIDVIDNMQGISTNVVPSDKEKEIIESLYLMCRLKQNTNAKYWFAKLPSIDYKLFFDFLLDDINMSFIKSIVSSYKDQKYMEWYNNIVDNCDTNIIYPVIKFTAPGYKTPTKVYYFESRGGLYDTDCPNNKLIDYFRKQTSYLPYIMVYFGYTLLPKNNILLFIFTTLQDRKEVTLLSNGIVDEALFVHGNIFVNTSKIYVEKMIYSKVYSFNDLLETENDYLKGVTFFSLNGFSHYLMEGYKFCTKPCSIIKGKFKTGVAAKFKVQGEDIVKSIPLFLRKYPYNKLYMESFAYYFKGTLKKIIPYKIKVIGKKCAMCGNFSNIKNVKVCTTCKNKLYRLLKNKGYPATYTFKNTKIGVLSDFATVYVGSTKGYRYGVSGNSGEILCIKRYGL